MMVNKMAENEPTKISKTEFMILQIMITGGSEMYGLEMLRKSGNKLKRGTIYTTLNRMEDKGLISSKKEASIQEGLTAKRRMYKVNGSGAIAANNFHNNMLGFLEACGP